MVVGCCVLAKRAAAEVHWSVKSGCNEIFKARREKKIHYQCSYALHQTLFYVVFFFFYFCITSSLLPLPPSHSLVPSFTLSDHCAALTGPIISSFLLQYRTGQDKTRTRQSSQLVHPSVHLSEPSFSFTRVSVLPLPPRRSWLRSPTPPSRVSQKYHPSICLHSLICPPGMHKEQNMLLTPPYCRLSPHEESLHRICSYFFVSFSPHHIWCCNGFTCLRIACNCSPPPSILFYPRLIWNLLHLNPALADQVPS